MIYVSLTSAPPDFAAYEAAIAPYLAPHDFGSTKIAHEADVIVRGNWKLFLENSRECYHCSVSHPELMRTFFAGYDFDDPAKDSTVASLWERCESAGLPSKQQHGPNYRLGRMPLAHGMHSMTMDGAAAVRRRLGKVPEGDIGAMRWVHFPNATNNHIVSDYAILHRVLPIDAQTTLVTALWLVDQAAEEGRDYDLQTLIKVWIETNDQDRRLVERNQEGVNSIAYRPGPYSQLTEGGVITFVEWYSRTMEDHFEPPARVVSLSSQR
jgi:Rieske 2Fe-2S family protein